MCLFFPFCTVHTVKLVKPPFPPLSCRTHSYIVRFILLALPDFLVFLPLRRIRSRTWDLCLSGFVEVSAGQRHYRYLCWSGFAQKALFSDSRYLPVCLCIDAWNSSLHRSQVSLVLGGFFSVSDFVLCMCTLITTSSLVARVESTPARVWLYSKQSIKEVVVLAALDSRGACPDTFAIRSHLVVACQRFPICLPYIWLKAQGTLWCRRSMRSFHWCTTGPLASTARALSLPFSGSAGCKKTPLSPVLFWSATCVGLSHGTFKGVFTLGGSGPHPGTVDPKVQYIWWVWTERNVLGHGMGEVRKQRARARWNRACSVAEQGSAWL